MSRATRITTIALSTLAGVGTMMPLSAHATSPGTIGRLYYNTSNSGGANAYAERDSQGNWVAHSSPLHVTTTAFSPDGSLVVSNAGLSGQLVTMRPDGTEMSPATWTTPGSDTPIMGAFNAGWIDQDHLVFVGPYVAPGNGNWSSGHIYISDLANKTSKELFANDPSCGEDAVSVNPVTKDIAISCWANGPQIWVSHYNTGAGTWADPVLLLVGAEAPDYSPDGQHIAYHDRAGRPATANADGSNAAELPNAPAGTYVNVKWSPDGTLIAADAATPDDRVVIEIMDPTGNVKATLGDAQHVASGPMWQPHPWTAPPAPAPTPTPTPATAPKVYRDAGADRIGTGIAISQQRWATGGSAKAVVLATSLNYPDALSGGPLAAKKGGPLLLTDGSATQLDPRVLAEIRRVLPAGGAVHVLGGDGAMKPAIVSQLKSLGYAITQYKGADRADTALRVARDGMGSPQHVVLATGAGYADALAAGPYAAGPFADGPGAPAAIVLSNDTHLDPATAAFLNGKTVATVGTQAEHAWPNAAKSFSGLNRFDTAARVAHEFTGAFANTQVGIANGIASTSNPGYPDALTGGTFMAESNGPIVLVDGIHGIVPAESKAALAQRTGNTRADIFGGTSIITPALAATIVTLLHGTAQF